MKAYVVLYARFAKHPEVERFILPIRRIVIVNLCACKNARIVKLIFDPRKIL